MSSIYSSRSSIVAHLRNWPHLPSDSSSREEPSTGNGEFDVDELIQKLEIYKMRTEEAAALQINQQRSISAKDVADVTAAARFQLELDQLDFNVNPKSGKSDKEPANDSHDLSTPGVDLKFPEPPRHGTLHSSRLRAARPAPLQLFAERVEALQVQSARLPPRTSSKTAPSFNHTPGKKSMKQHHRRMTITGGNRPLLMQAPGSFTSFDLEIAAMPELSHSASTATSPPSRSPLTPLASPFKGHGEGHTDVVILGTSPELPMSPAESPIAVKSDLKSASPSPIFSTTNQTGNHSPSSLESPVAIKSDNKLVSPSPVFTTVNQSGDQSPPSLESPIAAKSDLKSASPSPTFSTVNQSGVNSTSSLESIDESPTPDDNARPSLTRKKSFFSRFQRKSDVDKLLDLYMTDEQLEEEYGSQKTKQNKTKRYGVFRSRSSNEPTSPLKFETAT